MTDQQYLEAIGQTTIFDFLNEPIEIGSEVYIDLSSADEETLNYFRYHYPHVINSSGIVIKKKQTATGYALYLVDVNGEFHWLNENELKSL